MNIPGITLEELNELVSYARRSSQLLFDTCRPGTHPDVDAWRQLLAKAEYALAQAGTLEQQQPVEQAAPELYLGYRKGKQLGTVISGSSGLLVRLTDWPYCAEYYLGGGWHAYDAPDYEIPNLKEAIDHFWPSQPPTDPK